MTQFLLLQISVHHHLQAILLSLNFLVQIGFKTLLNQHF